MSYESDIGRTATVTAFFDERGDADRAVERLAEAGIATGSIRMVPGAERTATNASFPESGSGFWEALKDLFMPDEDRQVYAEGLRRGGYLVSVTVGDDQYEEALDILDDEGTIDMNERADTWRTEGWTGAGAAAFGAEASYVPDTASRGMSDDEEVISLAEEELSVGKRDVSHGRVRVRSYVVETPISEDVELREESVRVERRPVDRAVSGSDRLFQDRTIEVEERAEEAVVAKDTRVREELVISKDVEHRTETVSDTVRRTEVEIEDDRAVGSKGTRRRA